MRRAPRNRREDASRARLARPEFAPPSPASSYGSASNSLGLLSSFRGRAFAFGSSTSVAILNIRKSVKNQVVMRLQTTRLSPLHDTKYRGLLQQAGALLSRRIVEVEMPLACIDGFERHENQGFNCPPGGSKLSGQQFKSQDARCNRQISGTPTTSIKSSIASGPARPILQSPNTSV